MHHLKYKIEKVPISIHRAPCIGLRQISVKLTVRMIVNAGRNVILRVIRGKKIRLTTKNRLTIGSQPLSGSAKGNTNRKDKYRNMTDQKTYQTKLVFNCYKEILF